MRIALATDNTIPFHIPFLVDFVNFYTKSIKFFDARIHPRFKTEILEIPNVIELIKNQYSEEIKDYDVVFIVTSIPYENNFFFAGDDNICIVSLSGWNHLTNLPMSNGIIFIACEFIVKYIKSLGQSHDENTGCICDFLWDKRGIDICMRASFICEECKNSSKDNPWILKQEYLDIMSILNILSAASRSGLDILSDIKPIDSTKISMKSNVFDVFLCHNSQDKELVRSLNKKLKRKGLITWFDEEQIEPGDVWQTKLEKTIDNIHACLIIVGDSGLGPWQSAEQRAFIDAFLTRGCRVIPAIIGAEGKIPELPLFLKQFMWSDLRKDLNNKISRIVSVINASK